MKNIDSSPLPEDINELQRLVLSLQSELSAQEKTIGAHEETISTHEKTISTHEKTIGANEEKIQLLLESIRLFNCQRFTKSSEKSDLQPELFDEAECEQTDAPDQAEAIDEIGAESGDLTQSNFTAESPTKKKPGRKSLPEHLDRIIEEHDIAAAEKICACGCEKTHISDVVTEQLDIIPAIVQVIQHRRKQYVCKSCEQGIKTASLPVQPIPKSNASPGLLAHIAVAKYQDGLPLYRMETIFDRLQVNLPRNTLANWMIKSSELLQPIYNIFQDQLLSSGYIHMDETPVQVLKEPDKNPSSKSYMWVRKTGDPSDPDLKKTIVLFDYADSRSGNVVQSLLGDYQGYLQTDDYVGYHKKGSEEGITMLACFAHARRKFTDAKKSEPKLKNNKHKISKADMAIGFIAKLYALEKRIKDKSTAEKYQARQQEALPLLAKLKAWADKSALQITPKSALGKAIAYLLKNWVKLNRYTEDGRLNIDNNPVENAIRPFAIGRKNWLFSNSQAGAKASAMLYSIIETAKANNVEPYQYLRTVFTKLPQAKTIEDIEALLPWDIELLKLPDVNRGVD